MESYPSIYNLGHEATIELLKGPVIVQEKVDGSQFSFTVDKEGVLSVRSRGSAIYPESPPALFSGAVATVRELHRLGVLTPGFIYRGEVLQKPRHNALTYARTPRDHIILFDIQEAETGRYLPYPTVQAEAVAVGLECVPTLHVGVVETRDALNIFLDRESILGGCKIEGVVIKPLHYDLFGRDKKVVMGKWVSEAFREIHKSTWKADNPGRADIISSLIERYGTEARWQKAVQHLNEAGTLENSPKDIGPLLGEASRDIKKECEEEIKEALFKWAWPQISRGAVKELPSWYKEELLKRQFGE